jgi:hypothetical protein
MADNEPDECGIAPLTFRGWVKESCAMHDKFYVRDSWAQRNLTRREADNRFLLMMLEQSGGNVAKRAASYVMWGVSRLLGGVFWEGKR